MAEHEEKIIFQRPKSLAPVVTNYCPGCTHGSVNRLVAEVIDELDIEGDTIGVSPVGCSVMLYDFFACDFLEAAQERLRLTLIEGGESLGRKIDEPIVSRPGLALTGFFGHYGWRRIQLIGKAETAYLESLSPAERLSRYAALLEHGAYCFIFANGRKPGADTQALMRVHGAVVMVSPLKTRVIYRESAFVL